VSWSEVFKIASTLKDVRRKGWVRRGVMGPESVADHSFSLAVLAMAAAVERGLDPFKAAALALVHDLAEALTGDLTPDEKRGKDHREEERRAFSRITTPLPGRVANLFSRLYNEYSSQSSDEARLVSQLDKLEMALQSVRYVDEGRAPAGLALEFTLSALDSVTDPALRAILQGLAARLC